MNKNKFMIRILIIIALASTVYFFSGCSDSTSPNDSTATATDQQTLEKIATEDSAVTSFDNNFNDDDAMSLSMSMDSYIYPIKIGHKLVRLVNKTFNANVVGDTAYAQMSMTYEGVLIIAGSYNSTSTIDTVVKKPFSTTIKKNLIYTKIKKSVNIGNRIDSTKEWKLVALSLTAGGTDSANISISQMNISYENGLNLQITDPLNFYVNRGLGRWKNFVCLNKNENVTVQLVVNSAYADTDFVTISFGADMKGMHKAKKIFALVSSTPSATGYTKVYQQTFASHQFYGYYHAVVNVYPKQVITDISAPVEYVTWAFPYSIK